MIEVEKRALIDEATYKQLGDRILAMGGIDNGANDTNSTFYVADGWQLKVQQQLSQGTAKIAWKSGGIDGAASRREIELVLRPEDVENAKEVVSFLAPSAKVYPTEQKRHDYTIDSISVAIKYSPDWHYHVELDLTVSDADVVPDALHHIEQLGLKLGLQLLSEKEEKEFVEKAIEARAHGA